ncbi:MAG: AtpZ/AtpI family protein [Microgenomates group bacterium]
MKKTFYIIGKDLKIEKADQELLKKPKESLNKILLAKSLNIGYYLITPIFLGAFFGMWLDKIFATKPVFILLFFSLGVLGSFYNLLKIVKEMK